MFLSVLSPAAAPGTAACPPLTAPDGGTLDLSTTTNGSVARYTCNSGYTIDGPSERECQADETWTGVDPVCNRECIHGNTFAVIAEIFSPFHTSL